MPAKLSRAGRAPVRWRERFMRVCPERPVALIPDDAIDPASVRYAAVWKPKPGVLGDFPKLEVIFNLGAGVNAPPISYAVAGKQYIAVAAGGNFQLDFPLGDAIAIFGLPSESGVTQLTQMPVFASSLPSDLVSPITAALDAL